MKNIIVDTKKGLQNKLIEEMGDVLAIIRYVCEKHDIPIDEVEKRADEKLEKYKTWDSCHHCVGGNPFFVRKRFKFCSSYQFKTKRSR